MHDGCMTLEFVIVDQSQALLLDSAGCMGGALVRI